MPEILDHVTYLSREVGARPAGTEEEQQAALYITEQLQKEAGLSAVIEDFSGSSHAETLRIIIAVLAALAAILAQFIDLLAPFAIIVTLVVAVIAVLDVLGHPVFSKVFSNSVSQNVVAQYKPSYSGEPSVRRRKIVLMAHYDSGKTRFELGKSFIPILPILHWAKAIATVLLPVLLIVRFVGFPHAEGAFSTVFTVLVIIVALVAAIPAFFGIVHKLAPYNDGANCNASGVAVLLDVATRLGRGLVSEAELAQRNEATVHGRQAAFEAGVVPEGAAVDYEVSGIDEPDIAERSPEERLAAAKAAVAALTGKPVSVKAASDISGNLVKVKEPPISAPSESDMQKLRDETREAFSSIPESTIASALAHAEQRRDEAATPDLARNDAAGASAPVSALESASSSAYAALAYQQSDLQQNSSSQFEASASSVPDWYREAQAKAHKTDKGATVRQRSRYADAPSAAFVSSSSQAFPASAGETSSGSTLHTTQLVGEGGDSRPSQAELPANGQAEGKVPVEAPLPEATTDTSVDAVSAPQQEWREEAAAESLPGDPSPAAQASVSPQSDETSARALQDEKDPSELSAAPETSSAVPVAEIPLFAFDTAADLSSISDPSFLNSLQAASEEPASESAPVASEEAGRQSVPRVRLEASNVGKETSRPELAMEAPKQRAPLDDAAVSGKSAAKSLLTLLPSLSGAIRASRSEDSESSMAANPAAAEDDGARVDKATTADGFTRRPDRAKMRATLPSLSGSITRQGSLGDDEGGEGDDGAAPSTRVASTLGTAGMTGAFAPVGEELLKDVDLDDIYVEDADDSAYDENFTESGAFAGPGYVEMPKSRVGGFFGRFRRKNKQERAAAPEPSTSEWLDVEEDFDAREVGRARGGWESFRQDDEYDQYKDVEESFYQDDEYDQYEDAERSKRRWRGGAFSSERARRAVEGEGEVHSAAASGDSEHLFSFSPEEDDGAFAQELRQIYQFRHPEINTEVWFVALGSELADHSGAQRFLDEHSQELRGAIVVELEGLGAGELSTIAKEGRYRKVTASSRMGRYVSKASKESGVHVSTTSLRWSDSTASYLSAHGIFSMHLAGVEGGKVAYAGEAADSLDIVDAEKLARASDFVIGFLKSA